MTNAIIQYSEEQVKSMTNQELVDAVYKLNISNVRVIRRILKKTNIHLLNEIIKRTEFLNQHFHTHNAIVPIDAILYCLEHNITSHPTCKAPECSNTVNWSHHRFQTYCCNKCVGKDVDVIKKRENTTLKLHGATSIFKLKAFKDKIFEKQIMLYGGIGFSSPIINDKIQSTMENRFGVKYAGQSSELKTKIQRTNKLLYGNICSLHGEEATRKTIDTNIRKRGCPYPMMSDEVKIKSKNSCISHWGVENYTQSKEYHKTAHKKYTNEKYPGMTFSSSWEFMVYDFLIEHNIEFEYQLEPIPYEYDGKTYYYIPDFCVINKIYEVKGDMFFRVNESTGKEEMYKPWRRKEWSDEYYQWLCGKEEAKHQCMISNNVIILRKVELNNLNLVFNF